MSTSKKYIAITIWAALLPTASWIQSISNDDLVVSFLIIYLITPIILCQKSIISFIVYILNIDKGKKPHSRRYNDNSKDVEKQKKIDTTA